MSAIATAAYDLAKHFLIRQEWCSDKHTNTLINGIFLALLASLPTVPWKLLIRRLLTLPCLRKLTSKCRVGSKKARSCIVSRNQSEALSEEEARGSTFQASWMLNRGPFDDAFALFVISNYGWKFPVCGIYDFMNDTLAKESKPWFSLERSMQRLGKRMKSPFPIYSDGIDTVWLCSGSDRYYLSTTSEAFLKEFIQYIKREFVPKVANELRGQTRVIYCDHEERGVLFEDRTISRLITRHKPLIMRYLEDFQKANAKGGKSSFNGFGTYNLGLMLYGDYGTGKTELIRALAHYFQRDIEWVNLRLVKTMRKLRSCFEGYHEKIIVFEEFDFVQGVLNEEWVEKEQVSARQRILDRNTQLYASLQSASDPDVQKEIQESIEKGEALLKDLDDAVTKDNLMTLLSGLVEQRGRILCATTNHLDKIYPPLLRAGRFDLKLEFGKFNREEIRDLLLLMFPKKSDGAKIQAEWENFPEEVLTPVEIIALCHQYRDLDRILREISSVSLQNSS